MPTSTVVMLTILDEKNKGYALGASEFLTKPIDRKRLSGVLDRFRARDEDPVVLVVDDDPATQAEDAPAAAGMRVSRFGLRRTAVMGSDDLAMVRPDLIPARPDDAGDGRLRSFWPSCVNGRSLPLSLSLSSPRRT